MKTPQTSDFYSLGHQNKKLMKTDSHNQGSTSSAQPEKSGSPLHYRLTTEEWLQAIQDLKPRERDVLYYLRTLNPFGDRKLDIGVREVARALNCDPATVSRALKVLDSKGYIDLEMVNVQVKVLTKSQSVVSTQHCCPDTTVLSTDHDRCVETTPTIATQHQRSLHNDRKPEPAPDMDSRSPHTIHTDQTLKTLSPTHLPRERELLDFISGEVRKDNSIKRPRGYAKQCLKDDREFWIEKFLEKQNQQAEIDSSGAAAVEEFQPESIEQKRTRFIAQWSIPICRDGIRKAIANNPDLQLEIVGDELREIVLL